MRAYMDEWPLATKAEQASMQSQPNNGEITIVIPDWVQIQLVCIVLRRLKGCTNHLRDRRDLKADALIGFLKHET